MGQAGSVEQRNAIRDVVGIKPASIAQERDAVVAALQAFCKMFPIEAAGSEAPLSSGEENGGSAGSLDVKESKLFFVIHALLQHATERTEKNSKEDLIGLTLTSIKRVILWRDLYRLGAKCSMKPFLNCLLLSPMLARSALHVLLSLTGICPGADANEKTEKWETLNRRNFADSGGYDVLRSLLVDHGGGGNTVVSTSDGDTVLTLVLEMFHTALVTRRHTSDISTTSLAVGALLNARIALLCICHHPNSTVQEYAIDLVIELFFLIDLEQVHELQESAREYGALLYALSAVVSERKKCSISSDDGSSTENTGDLTPTNSASTLRTRYLDLVEIFCAGNTRSKKAISRMFPVELFIPLENRAELISRHTASSILKSTRNNRSLPSFTFDFELRSSADNKRGRVGSLVGSGSKLSSGGGGAFDKWLQEAKTQGEDWKKIIASLHDDHERPDLVWKAPMRNELRQALRAEIEKFEHLRGVAATTNPGSSVRWEHDMFRVEYVSMKKELVVHGYFVECLIPILADLSNQFEVVEPLVFAWHLTDRLAVEDNELWRILCIRCLRLTVRRYAMVLQGQVPTRYILELLRNHSDHSPQFIRECFLLLSTAILTTRNAPSESLDNVSSAVATAVVNVLSDSTLVSRLSRSSQRGVEDDIDPAYDFDEENVLVRNGSDGLVRAGISVLQAIIRRSKYTLQLIRPKRVFLCRLLAVETLDHVTVNRILTILKQFVHLDSTSGFLANTKASHTVAKPAVDANWKALALVYILVACCDPNGRGMSVAAAEFLKENYCDTLHCQPPASKKSCDESSMPGNLASSTDKLNKRRKVKKSEFNELLNDALGFEGCGIGSLLRSSEPKIFCDIFNAEVKKSADVLWGRRQRMRLFRYLKRKFVASSSDLSSSNQSEECDGVVFPADLSSEDAPTLLEGSDDDIFVGNIFLRSYVEGDGEFLNEWTPDMYKSLIQALFVRLMELSRTKSVFGVSGGHHAPPSGPAEPWEVQVLILKALIRLLPTHFAYVEIKDEFYEALLLPLRRSLLGDTDQIRGTLGLDLLIALLLVPPQTSSNATACCQYLADRGLQTIAEALEKMMNSAYQQLLASDLTQEPNRARELLSRATDLLITLSSNAEGATAIEKNPGVVTALLSLSSKHYISSYSPVAVATCLDCLTKLCLHDSLRTVVISAGGLLYLLDICVFCPVGPGLIEPPPPAVDTDEANGSTASDTSQNKTHEASFLPLPPVAFAVRSSAVTLQACLVDSQGEECTASIQVLKQLLTPSFVRILRLSPERFVLRLQSADDICTSTLIWTTSMRRRLRDTLAMELTKVKTAARSNVWPRWNPDHFIAADSFRYQYPELADELIVHDVYINKFVSSDGVALEDIDMSAFSQALLISIQSGENVLRILQQRGASDPAKERSVVVMRLALNKLVTTHPQHNLQVDPTPPTSIGMTSLIENESSDESEDDDDTSTAGSSVGGFRVQNSESALERSSTLDDLTV